MSATIEQLPAIESHYDVPGELCQAFQRDGHALVKNLAKPEEFEPYRPHIGAAVEQNRKEKRKLAERDTYHKAFIQVGNLWEVDEYVKRFVLARRFAQVAADLMGVDGVRIYHDQALFKEPGGGHTPWHQDQYYWPIKTDKTVTMWMPLVDAPVETGPMVFASGSQKDGPLVQLPIGDESSRIFPKLARERGYPLATYELLAGDATFHAGWTLHKTPGNSTSRVRETMTVIYVADGAKVAEPMNEHQPVDMERWFPGLKPGDVINTHLNPLVYRRGG